MARWSDSSLSTTAESSGLERRSAGNMSASSSPWCACTTLQWYRQLTCRVQSGLRVRSAAICSEISAASAPAAISAARSRHTARSLRSIWWMSLSCRCMSTPNAVSPLALAVMSEQSRPPQGVLDASDVLDEIAGVVAREHVFIANTRAHRNGEVSERIRGRHVCLGVADDDGRVIVGHRLPDQPRFLKRRVTPRRCSFDRLEKGCEGKDGELRPQRCCRRAQRHERAAKGRDQPGEHRDGLGEQDVEPKVVRQLDEFHELCLETGDLRFVETALGQDLGPSRALSLQLPVRGTSQRLTAERFADRAVDVMVPRRHVEQGSVEVKDERRRPLPWQSAPPTRLEKRDPERIRSPGGTA